MVPVDLWLNGKRGERWYHLFDYSKYKPYEGSFTKEINFSSKVLLQKFTERVG